MRSESGRSGRAASADGRAEAVRSSAATLPPGQLNALVARRREGFADRLRGFARPWELACFIWVPAIALAYVFWYELRARSALEDFGISRAAARAVLHGRSPYV